MAKRAKPTSTRHVDENARPRRCCYCGRLSSCPSKQKYEPTTYVVTDPPEAPGGARWAHSPRATDPPPLCAEARKGHDAQARARTE